MEPTLQIALNTKARLLAILDHHQVGRLSRTQWQGISDTDFKPSNDLTYLTPEEFNDFLALGWLQAFAPLRISPLVTGAPETLNEAL